jgi:hypothetical protein
VGEKLSLTGAVTIEPSTGNPSGFVGHTATLDETISLSRSTTIPVELSSDTAVAVPFGSLATGAIYVQIKSTGKVKARFTSADGTTQSIPVDDLLILKALSVPITALDLTRVAGQATSAEVLLGQ